MKHKVKESKYTIFNFTLLGGLLLMSIVKLKLTRDNIRLSDVCNSDNLFDEIDTNKLCMYADPLFNNIKKTLKPEDIVKNPIRVYSYEFMTYGDSRPKTTVLRFEWNYDFNGTKLTFYRTLTLRQERERKLHEEKN